MTTNNFTQSTITEDEHKFPNLPPFPNNVPIAPLHRLSLTALRSSPEESLRLFQASKDLGFFYLDLRGDPEGEELLRTADHFFEFAPKFYELSREELQKYDYKSKGSYMGYKGIGGGVADAQGNLDRNEFYNIPKDDFLSISKEPFAHPPLLYEYKPLIKSYITQSHALVTVILSHLNTHLHLPPLTLENLHRLMQVSGDQVRMIKAPPQPASDMRTSLAKHTDFGSITLLFNRLGGLQILPPPLLVPEGKEPEWTYVKPLPGHCIVNLGDAMVKFTRGVLRSNIHRVFSPPGEQAKETRYSIVYFSRPCDDILLKALSGGDVIPEGVEEENVSAKDWIIRKAMSFRQTPVTSVGS